MPEKNDPPQASTDNPEPTPASGTTVPKANFLQFLSGMAAQALIHLGRMSHPVTGKRAVDLPNAKYTIDLLGILEEKTTGNLTDEEAAYLQAALRELRVAYTQSGDEPPAS